MNYSTLPLFALKVCTFCNQSKPLSEFHKQGNGLRSACKVCTNAQNRDIYQKNHDDHLEAKRRYRRENPDARRETLHRYEQTHRYNRHAHYAVKREIRAGRMPAASELQCETCGAAAETYHHWSYEPEHWLDTIPLCRVCHGKEHRAYES